MNARVRLPAWADYTLLPLANLATALALYRLGAENDATRAFQALLDARTDAVVLNVAAHPDVDAVMAAIVGAAGLRPTVEAIRRGAVIALANKECLVSAGAVFLEEVARSGAELLPVDSEHSAAFQALQLRRSSCTRR